MNRTLTQLIEDRWCESSKFNADRSQLTIESKSYHHSCDSFEVTSKDVTDKMLDDVDYLTCETIEEFEAEIYDHITDWFEDSYGDEDYICFSNCVYEEEFPTLTSEIAGDKCEVFRTHPYKSYDRLVLTLPTNRKRGDVYSPQQFEKMVTDEEILDENPCSGYDHHISLGEEFISNLYKRYCKIYGYGEFAEEVA